jgi:hypothetical protein
MSRITNPNQIDGKRHLLGKPGVKQDFLQLIPAVVTGVINHQDAVLSRPSNPYDSNLIEVSVLIWSTDLNYGKADKRKAKPLFRGFSDSITIDEVVLVTEIGGQLYYLGPLNIANNPSFNYNNMDTGKLDDFYKGTDAIGGSVTFPDDVSFKRMNKSFKPELDDPLEGLERFTHPESGNEVFTDLNTDSIIEGRFGNSIRVGNRNINPYILISNGRDENQIEESINDGSIFSMIEQGSINQHFNQESLDEEPYQFKFADEEIEEPIQTIRNTFLTGLGRGLGVDGEDDSEIDTTLYDYASPQSILNSDRIVINARKENMFLSAFQHLHLGSGNTMTFSTSNNILFNVNDSFVVNSPEIKLGSQIDDETQPIALGDNLVAKLEELCDHLTQLCTDIQSMTHPTPAGPSGPPVNAASFASVSSAIGQTKSALAEILSQRNRTA